MTKYLIDQGITNGKRYYEFDTNEAEFIYSTNIYKARYSDGYSEGYISEIKRFKYYKTQNGRFVKLTEEFKDESATGFSLLGKFLIGLGAFSIILKLPGNPYISWWFVAGIILCGIFLLIINKENCRKPEKITAEILPQAEGMAWNEINNWKIKEGNAQAELA